MIWLSDKEKVKVLRGALHQSMHELMALARMHNFKVEHISSIAASEKALEDTAPKG